jgi:tight adherence protein C
LNRTFTLTDLAAARLALTIVLAFLALVPLPDVGRAVQFAALGAALAWFYPSAAVRALAVERLGEIRRAFPEALDVIATGLESGTGRGFEHMVGLYAEGFPGPLADELSSVLHVVRSGQGRETALRRLAARCPLAEVTSFTNAVLQAERFGTSIALVLRVQSAVLKLLRRQAIEERTQKMATYLVLPTAIYLISLALLLVGPIVISFSDIVDF